MKTSNVIRLVRSIVFGLAFVGSGAIVFINPAPASAQVMSKSCSNCGASVSLSSRVGEQCPHCGAYWSGEQTRYREVDAGPQTHTKSPTPPAVVAPSAEHVCFQVDSEPEAWPSFKKPLYGANQLCLENDTGRDMWLALRCGEAGVAVWLPAFSTARLPVPPGSFSVFGCVYPCGVATRVKANDIDVTEDFGGIHRLRLWRIEGIPTTSDTSRPQDLLHGKDV
jgi:hypothetical protein